MDKTQKHYIKQKKRGTEEFILYNFINMMYKNRQKQSMLMAVRIAFASGG